MYSQTDFFRFPRYFSAIDLGYRSVTHSPAGLADALAETFDSSGVEEAYVRSVPEARRFLGHARPNCVLAKG
jgi:hypothetical protein